MRLTITTKHGETVVVIAEIEDYNLDKPVAKADVIQSIQTALAEARALEGSWEADKDRRRLSKAR